MLPPPRRQIGQWRQAALALATLPKHCNVAITNMTETLVAEDANDFDNAFWRFSDPALRRCISF